ncbi:unnamed protein product [Mytilus edulis]|uniref:SGNH hydrolase-type esterase domain-containing protein n=1 Tax=Mytilus edulis TaxID=6550 RepID=A0A8S3VLK2_MYTED|nr:unnamed protein product [Mytilus edulis]
MNEETNPKILLTSSMTNSEKDNENHKTENKDKTLNKSEKHAPVTNATNKDENYINLPEQVDSNAVLMINNRLDIFEESLVKITSTLANTIDILGINHTDTLQELRKIKKSKGSSETLQPEIKLFENQIKEKDDMISSLRKEVQQLNELQDRNQKKYAKELENTKTEHQNQISVIREEKIQSNIETEKLSLKLEQIQNDKDNLKMTFKERIDDKDKTIHNLQERIQSFLYDRDGEPWKKQTKRVSQDNNSSFNNDQQEENLASNLDLTAEPQNSSDRMSLTTDESLTSIQQHLDINKSNSQNNKNDGDIPYKTPKSAVNGAYLNNAKLDTIFYHDSIGHKVDIKRLLAGSGQAGLKQTTYRIENVIEALEDISSARSIIIHVGINDIKVRDDSAEDIFPRYEEMVNKALGKANSVVLSLVIPTKYTLLNKKSQALNEMIKLKFATTSTLLICENNNFTADNGDVMENLYSDSIRLSIYQGTGVLAGNIRKTMFPQRQSENKRVSKTDHSTNYRGRTKYNYNHRLNNTGYNKSHQYKGDNTRRPLYNNNWYTQDDKTELGHYRNDSIRKSFDYDNSYNTDGEVNYYRNYDNSTSQYNQSYRHEMDRDLSQSQISDLATSIASAFANVFKCH